MNTTVVYRFSIIVLLFSIPFGIKAQFDFSDYDKEKFLIGTLNDYMGYQRTFTNGNNFYYQRIDIMSKDDLRNAVFIDSLFNQDYPDITIVNNGAPQGIKIYSPLLSEEIDTYYSYEVSRQKTGAGDTIYAGRLIKDCFKTERDKLSFLLGAYLRYGYKRKTDEPAPYYFSIPNSGSKYILCEEFLKDIDCMDVEFMHRKSIPSGFIVYFNPSPKMQKIIDDVEHLNIYIAAIDIDNIKFTADGDKFIWQEPDIPTSFANGRNSHFKGMEVISKDSIK